MAVMVTTRTSSRADGSMGRGLLVLAAAALAGGAWCAPGLASQRPDPALPSELSELYRHLEGLGGEAFLAVVDDVLRERPNTGVAAIILRAGVPLYEGLTTDASTRRKNRAADALQRIRADVEEVSSHGDVWLHALARLIADPSADAILRSAALRVAAKLERHELAPDIADCLEDEQAFVVETARAALFAFYGRWFGTSAAAQEFLGRARNLPGEAVFAGEFRAAVLERRALWQERILKRNPELAAELLEPPHTDPWLRRLGALRVVRGASSPGFDIDKVRALLLARLDGETDLGAFDGLLVGLRSILSGEAPDSAAVAEVRARLDAVAASGRPHLDALVLHAFSLLPCDPAAPEDAPHSYSWTVKRASALLLRIGDPTRFEPTDVLAAGLSDWKQLYAAAPVASPTLAATVGEVKELVYRLLDDRTASAEVVGVAATLAPLLTTGDGDLGVILKELEGPATPLEVRFRLLTSLEEAAASLDPRSDEATALLRALGRLAAHDEAGLRRRALALLASTKLAAILDAGRADIVATLDARLQSEPEVELQKPLLLLVERLGDPRFQDTILARAELNLPDVVRIRDLAAALRATAARDPARSMQAARWIVGDAGTSGRRDLPLRLAAALGLVVAPDEAAALAGLTAQDHALIVGWTHDLRRLEAAAALKPEVRARVSAVHLPAAEEAGRNVAHLRALLAADATPLDGAAPAALKLFETALTTARADPGVNEWEVLRDRARFRRLRGELAAARADYATLDERLRDTATSDAVRAVLEAQDYREAATLLAGDGSDAAAALRAFRLGADLIGGEGWARRPADERVQDLVAWVRHARASRDAAVMASVQQALADMPDAKPDADYGKNGHGPPGAVWYALDDDKATHARLLTARRELADELAQGTSDEREPEGGAITPDGGPGPGPGAARR